MRTHIPTSWKLGLIVALVAATAPPVPIAQASAIGYDYWGVHVFKDIPIPAGQLTGAVWGEGLYIHDWGGNFGSAGNICNWHFSLHLIDGDGDTYDKVAGKTVTNCTHAGQQKYLLKRNVKPGKACVRLYTNFSHRVASVCHSIHD